MSFDGFAQMMDDFDWGSDTEPPNAKPKGPPPKGGRPRPGAKPQAPDAGKPLGRRGAKVPPAPAGLSARLNPGRRKKSGSKSRSGSASRVMSKSASAGQLGSEMSREDALSFLEHEEALTKQDLKIIKSPSKESIREESLLGSGSDEDLMALFDEEPPMAAAKKPAKRLAAARRRRPPAKPSARPAPPAQRPREAAVVSKPPRARLPPQAEVTFTTSPNNSPPATRQARSAQPPENRGTGSQRRASAPVTIVDSRAQREAQDTIARLRQEKTELMRQAQEREIKTQTLLNNQKSRADQAHTLELKRSQDDVDRLRSENARLKSEQGLELARVNEERQRESIEQTNKHMEALREAEQRARDELRHVQEIHKQTTTDVKQRHNAEITSINKIHAQQVEAMKRTQTDSKSFDMVLSRLQESMRQLDQMRRDTRTARSVSDQERANQLDIREKMLFEKDQLFEEKKRRDTKMQESLKTLVEEMKADKDRLRKMETRLEQKEEQLLLDFTSNNSQLHDQRQLLAEERQQFEMQKKMWKQEAEKERGALEHGKKMQNDKRQEWDVQREIAAERVKKEREQIQLEANGLKRDRQAFQAALESQAHERKGFEEQRALFERDILDFEEKMNSVGLMSRKVFEQSQRVSTMYNEAKRIQQQYDSENTMAQEKLVRAEKLMQEVQTKQLLIEEERKALERDQLETMRRKRALIEEMGSVQASFPAASAEAPQDSDTEPPAHHHVPVVVQAPPQHRASPRRRFDRSRTPRRGRGMPVRRRQRDSRLQEMNKEINELFTVVQGNQAFLRKARRDVSRLQSNHHVTPNQSNASLPTRHTNSSYKSSSKYFARMDSAYLTDSMSSLAELRKNLQQGQGFNGVTPQQKPAHQVSQSPLPQFNSMAQLSPETVLSNQTPSANTMTPSYSLKKIPTGVGGPHQPMGKSASDPMLTRPSRDDAKSLTRNLSKELNDRPPLAEDGLDASHGPRDRRHSAATDATDLSQLQPEADRAGPLDAGDLR